MSLRSLWYTICYLGLWLSVITASFFVPLYLSFPDIGSELYSCLLDYVQACIIHLSVHLFINWNNGLSKWQAAIGNYKADRMEKQEYLPLNSTYSLLEAVSETSTAFLSHKESEVNIWGNSVPFVKTQFYWCNSIFFSFTKASYKMVIHFWECGMH